MATWRDIADEFRTAAGVCARNGLARSAVGRAYYAFFAQLTHELARRGCRMAYATNPGHRDVVRHIRTDLSLGPVSTRRLVALARNLYDRRLDADYNGPYAVDDRTARESLRDMAEARRILGGV